MKTQLTINKEMRDQVEELHQAFASGYTPKYLEGLDGDSYIWRWEDLFTSEGKDSPVWRVEIFEIFLKRLTRLALEPDYEGGLLCSTAVFGPGKEGEPHDHSWDGYWDSEIIRAYYHRYHQQGLDETDERGLGEQALIAHAINQANELYEHFVTWPEQEHLLLAFVDHVANE